MKLVSRAVFGSSLYAILSIGTFAGTGACFEGEATMTDITVVVVDDHPIFQQGMIDSLSLEPDILVVGRAADGNEAIDLIKELEPSIALLDVNLPGINGQQVARQVVHEKLKTRVILVTAYDDLEQVIHAMRAGAWAFCAKDINPEALTQVIRSVAAGNYVVGDRTLTHEELDEWLASFLENVQRSYSDPGEPYYPLSGREMEVLVYLTKGQSNKEIATLLGISHQTVKNHVTSILRKLDVEDRTQAAVYALRRGWVRLDTTNEQ
jgi:DNA-binding NarL/FixJ family response regulator